MGWWARYNGILKTEYPTVEAKAEAFAALEAEYPGRASAFRGRVTMAFLLVIYAIAGAAWGLAVHGAVIWFAAGGAVLGALLGALGAAIISRARSVSGSIEMQAVAGAVFGLPGVAIGVLGLVVWLVRAVFFR